MVDRIVQDFLGQASRKDFDQTRLLQSLVLLVEYLKTSIWDAGTRDAVCKAIIDNVLPKVTLLSLREQEELATLCQQVLYHGNAEKVFHDLCISLKRARHDVSVNARFLVTFVSIGGVERLARVLAKLESHETISFLIHLPSLVMNALGSSDLENNVFTENEYFVSLSNAICKVSTISDHQSSSFLGTLIQRMVTLGKAKTIISSSCALEGSRHFKAVLKRAPHASIEALLRAILEVDISSSMHGDEAMLKEVLCSLVLNNATAEEACIGRIPFSQPPLKRPKIALARLVDAVAHKANGLVWKRAISTAASIWNSPEFTYCAELLLQQQVTRLLLYFMSRRIRGKMLVVTETEGLVLLFSPGIQLRLGENDPRIRRHGMVVGEAASRTEKGDQKLSFPRGSLNEEIAAHTKLAGAKSNDEGSDSDFSVLADGIDCNEDAEETGVQGKRGTSELHDASGRGISLVSNTQSSSYHVQRDSQSGWSLGIQEDDWQYEDDWESIDSWDDEDLISDTNSTIVHFEGVQSDGTTFRVPVSVNHLLGLMINANKSKGGGLQLDTDTVAAALDQISALPNSGLVYGDTLRCAAVELCLEVCRLDVERYPDEDKDRLVTARSKALEQMICFDLEGCGLALIDKVICGPSSDVSRRIEALATLTKSFRWSFFTDSSQSQTMSSRADGRGQHAGDMGFRVVKRMPSKTGKAAEPGKMSLSSAYALKTAGMLNVFHHLAQRMCEGGGAGFLDVESRDSQLWAHAIVALATVASCVGMSREGVEMRSSVIEISMRRVLRLEADAVVRRAVVLAVITVIRSMGSVEVSEILAGAVSCSEVINVTRSSEVDVAAECFQWLTNASEFDADIGVRRFTKQALGLWARRVAQIS